MHAQLQDISYRLGAAETRVAKLDIPKRDDDTARDRPRRSSRPKPSSPRQRRRWHG